MRPSSPFRRTWLRYMPVMPASASTAIRTFKEFRMATSVVVMEVVSRWGCLTWTPMKMSPAIAAAMPAARVRLVVVTVMATLLGLVELVRARCPGMAETLGGGVVTAHHHVM
jgi:hypothetical protein